MNRLSSYFLSELKISHCREICGWRYEPPYDTYNWSEWEQMNEEESEFADPVIRETQYSAVLDAEGTLCGFAQFFPLEGVTRLGLGMRPDLCGQGIGVAFVEAIVREAILRKPENEIDLEVLRWNVRARTVYERAGFRVSDEYRRNTPVGNADFYCMVLDNRKCH